MIELKGSDKFIIPNESIILNQRVPMTTSTSENTAIPASPALPKSKKLPPPIRSIYVYEVPVRLWHWINAAAVLILCLTGYFIGSPIPTMSGEASDHYLFGYLRFTHFAAGYILAIGFLGRLYWAFAGNSHAKEIFYILYSHVFSGKRWARCFHGMPLSVNTRTVTLAITLWHDYRCF